MITTNTIETFATGKRVQLHPALDRWMMGDRYGEVVKITQVKIIQTFDELTTGWVYVKLDKSGTTMRFLPMLLEPIN